MRKQPNYNSQFDIAYKSYTRSLSKIIHSLNQKGELEEFLLKFFVNYYKTIEIETGFYCNEKYGVNLILKYKFKNLGLDFETKIFLIVISDENHNYNEVFDALATGIWAYKSERALILISGQNKKMQLIMKNEILNRISELDFNKKVEILDSFESVKFLQNIGSLNFN